MSTDLTDRYSPYGIGQIVDVEFASLLHLKHLVKGVEVEYGCRDLCNDILSSLNTHSLPPSHFLEQTIQTNPAVCALKDPAYDEERDYLVGVIDAIHRLDGRQAQPSGSFAWNDSSGAASIVDAIKHENKQQEPKMQLAAVSDQKPEDLCRAITTHRAVQTDEAAQTKNNPSRMSSPHATHSLAPPQLAAAPAATLASSAEHVPPALPRADLPSSAAPLRSGLSNNAAGPPDRRRGMHPAGHVRVRSKIWPAAAAASFAADGAAAAGGGRSVLALCRAMSSRCCRSARVRALPGARRAVHRKAARVRAAYTQPAAVAVVSLTVSVTVTHARKHTHAHT